VNEEKFLAAQLAALAAADKWRRIKLPRPAALPTRRRVKQQRKFARTMAVKLHNNGGRASMMHRGAEPGHRVPRADERTKMMFAAHERRKEAGWIHG